MSSICLNNSSKSAKLIGGAYRTLDFVSLLLLSDYDVLVELSKPFTPDTQSSI